jgi:hypothetical protein
MDWEPPDDELDQLVLKVAELYGDGALSEAYARAMNAAPRATIDSLERRPDIIVDHDLSGYTYVVEGPALRSALKAELRRLVTPR